MKILKNQALRAILYIIFFAGALRAISYFFEWTWNKILRQKFDLDYITTLESVGILAFIYLIYAGIKFGYTYTLPLELGKQSSEKPNCESCALRLESLRNAAKNKLSEEEKAIVNRFIEKSCGIDYSHTRSQKGHS